MRLSSLLMLVPVATVALYACSDDHGDDVAPPSGYEDVELAGSVTDEALVAFASALDQKAPVDSPSQKTVLDLPTEGAALPKSPIPQIAWHAGPVSRRASPASHWAALEPRPKPGAASFASPLRELFGPIPSAHAHGTPFTGTATYLVFSIDSNPKLVRAITSETSYTPPQASWDKLVAAGKPIKLTLVTALFEQNRVLEGGGPFTGGEATFTITP